MAQILMSGPTNAQVLVVNQANGFMKGVSGLWQSLSGDVLLSPAEISYRNSCGLYLYYRQAWVAVPLLMSFLDYKLQFPFPMPNTICSLCLCPLLITITLPVSAAVSSLNCLIE